MGVVEGVAGEDFGDEDAEVLWAPLGVNDIFLVLCSGPMLTGCCCC